MFKKPNEKMEPQQATHANKSSLLPLGGKAEAALVPPSKTRTVTFDRPNDTFQEGSENGMESIHGNGKDVDSRNLAASAKDPSMRWSGIVEYFGGNDDEDSDRG